MSDFCGVCIPTMSDARPQHDPVNGLERMGSRAGRWHRHSRLSSFKHVRPTERGAERAPGRRHVCPGASFHGHPELPPSLTFRAAGGERTWVTHGTCSEEAGPWARELGSSPAWAGAGLGRRQPGCVHETEALPGATAQGWSDGWFDVSAWPGSPLQLLNTNLGAAVKGFCPRS